MAKRPPKQKPEKTKFTAKQRKIMVGDLEKVDYQNLIDSAVKQLQCGLHLELCPDRREFVRAICEGTAKEALTACILEMVMAFLDIYKLYMKGKRYANLEQEWMRHIDDYIASEHTEADDTTLTIKRERKRLWDNLVSAAACPMLDNQGKRIILSTLCCIVYDLMVETVKKYKLHINDTEEPTTSSESKKHDEAVIFKLTESNSSLYRYGGFALHSMLKKWLSNNSKFKSRSSLSSVQHMYKQELEFLQHLKIQRKRWTELPIQIQHLQKGGLEMVTPDILPFLRQLVDKVASHVNDNTRQEHGSSMIEVAKKRIKEDEELEQLFIKCTPEAPSDVVKAVYTEFCMKVFHARVNEYISASEEMELERTGKAVKVEQCLRDQLKTFSALQKRS